MNTFYTANAAVMAADGDLKLKDGWNNFMTAVRGASGFDIFIFLSVVGVILIVYAIIRFLAKRIKTGSMSGGKELVIPLVLGIILAGLPWAMGWILDAVEILGKFFGDLISGLVNNSK